MKSLQEYIEIYRGIARGLNLQGDSVEMLSQMLANATYISEVEHIAYSQEASLERATLMNSKIQHCMNEMYSVFRGSCPRVIIRFKSNAYFSWNIFDEISVSNNFSVYYLGYLDTSSGEDNLESADLLGTSAISDHKNFIYSPIIVPPTGEEVEYTIIALISPKLLKAQWTLKENRYYVDFLESNLSNDMMVKVNGEYHDVTRVFADHIKNASIFDLTLPDFGMRLYSPDIFRNSSIVSNEITETPANTNIYAEVFRYSTLDSYNLSELKQIKIKGTKLSSIPVTWSNSYNYPPETAPGLIFLDEVSRDTLGTIHYKSVRDRYTGSMLRSNSDIGVLLEEMYPDKVRKSGTSFAFESLQTTRKVVKEVKTNYNLTEEADLLEGLKNVTQLKSGITVYGGADSDFNLESNLSYKPSFAPSTLYTSCITLNNLGTFEDMGTKLTGGIIEVPIKGSGKLRLLHRNSYSPGTAASYEIIPEVSVITRRYSGDNKSELVTKVLGLNVIRSSFGVVDVLSFNQLGGNGLKLYYSFDNSGQITQVTSSTNLDLTTIDPSQRLTQRLTLYLKANDSDEILDEEIIPVIYVGSNEVSGDSSVSTTTVKDTTDSSIEKTTITTVSNNISSSEANTGELVLGLSNDSIYLETLDSGEIITSLPITITASVFSGGNLVTSSGKVNYEVVSSYGVKCSINNSGVLTITGFDTNLESTSIVIRATYEGVSLSGIISVRTNISVEAFKNRELCISDDPSGLTKVATISSTSSGSCTDIPYTNTSNAEFLYIWASVLPGIQIYSIEWIEDYVTYENILQEDESISPSLVVYYIPQLPSSLLTQSEIDDYVLQRSSYYVTHDIEVKRGNVVNVLINIKLEIFKNISVDSEVKSILENYSYQFGVDLEKRRSEIISSISKITNVKCLNSLNISYTHELGESLEWADIMNDLDKTYFVINYQISSTITT